MTMAGVMSRLSFTLMTPYQFSESASKVFGAVAVHVNNRSGDVHNELCRRLPFGSEEIPTPHLFASLAVIGRDEFVVELLAIAHDKQEPLPGPRLPAGPSSVW